MIHKILVIGGNGFVGANLVKQLYKQKNHLTIFSHKEPLHPFLKGLRIKIIEGDIRNYKSLLKVIKGQDYVYHLAALTYNDEERKKQVFSVNVDGTENVLKACLKSKVKKVVHVSTCGVLGFSKNKNELLDEYTHQNFADNQYSNSKKISERIALKYVSKGLQVTIANPSFVVGAGEIDSSRYVLAQSISKGRIKVAFPGGGGTVGIEDLVDGLILVMKKGKSGKRYILNNENVLLVDRFNMMADILKKPRIKFVIPRFTYYPMYILGFFAQKLVKNPPISTEIVRWYFNYRNFDNTKAKKDLGWKPKITLKESLKRTIKYYETIGAL